MSAYREPTRAEMVQRYELELATMRDEHRREVAAWKKVAEAGGGGVWSHVARAVIWSMAGAAMAGAGPMKASWIAGLAIGALALAIALTKRSL